MSTKKKLSWLLILQGWTMLWVVLGHAPLELAPNASAIDVYADKIAGALFNFAYSFHMPLFIMISGYLFYRTRIAKEWKYWDMVKEKWMRLGIPYLIFITIAIIVKFLIPGANRAVDVSGTGLIMNYIDPFNGALQEMWFVAVIFWYFLIYPVYKYIFKYGLVSIIVVFFIAWGMYNIPQSWTTTILAIDRAIHFFIYFYVGLVISKLNLEKYLAHWGGILGSVICYAISIFIDSSLFIALFASLGFWGLAIMVDKTLTTNLFHSFRDYTYQIFLIGIFAQIFAKLLAKIVVFPGSYPVWWLVCVLLGIYVPVLISKIPAMRNNKFLRRAIGL